MNQEFETSVFETTAFETIVDESVIEPIDRWSSHCFVAKNPYHDLLKASLIELIYSDANSSDEAIKSQVAMAAKANLQESDFSFLDKDEPNLQTLNVYLTDLIGTVVTEVNQPYWPEDSDIVVNLTESWYHITKDGGYHDSHSHPNCSWCGIYYVDAGDSDQTDKNGINRFYDPRTNAGHFLDAGSQYLNETGIWDVAPAEGQVVIFPSYLRHSALPYFGQKDRVIIAFNARVDFDHTE